MAVQEGSALVLQARPWGEGGVVAMLFCPGRGLIKGLVKRGATATLQPMNRVAYRHTRRLDSQLGTLQLELTKSRAALWLGQPGKALGVAAVADLLAALLPEEHPYPVVAEVLDALLESDFGWQAYAGFERVLLEQTGYGLQLQDPVPCAAHSPLAYVSPTTWRAVPRQVAQGWEAKLLTLPACWGGLPMPEYDDCTAALSLTGALLSRALHGPFAAEKLAARERLVQHYQARLPLSLAAA